MSWKRFSWVDGLALPAALAVLRVVCLWPWLELLRRWLAPSWPQPFLGLTPMLAAFLAALAMARLARDHLSRRWAQLAVASGGLVAVLLAEWWQLYHAIYAFWNPHWVAALGSALTHWQGELPAAFAAALVAAYLWLRGLLDGRQRLSRDHTWRAFIGGFFVLAAAVVVATADGAGAPASAFGLVLLYFTAGLAALAITGLQLTRGSSQPPAGARLEASLGWLASVGLIIGGLLAAALALDALLAPLALARAWRWVGTVMAGLGRLLEPVGLGLSYVIFLVLDPLIRWLKAHANLQWPGAELQLPQIEQEIRELVTQGARQQENAAGVYTWLGLVGLVLALGLIFALAAGHRRRAIQSRGIEETRETIFSGDLLQDQVSAIMRNWAARLRRISSQGDAFLSLLGEEPARRSIRAVYQALLRTAAASGHPRRPGQTPSEYRQTLEEAWPGTGPSLEALTQAYLAARYAADPPEMAEAARVGEEWRRLQELVAARGEGGRD